MPEILVGRNPVVEALRAGVPATALYVAQGIEQDARVAESVRSPPIAVWRSSRSAGPSWTA